MLRFRPKCLILARKASTTLTQSVHEIWSWQKQPCIGKLQPYESLPDAKTHLVKLDEMWLILTRWGWKHAVLQIITNTLKYVKQRYLINKAIKAKVIEIKSFISVSWSSGISHCIVMVYMQKQRKLCICVRKIKWIAVSQVSLPFVTLCIHFSMTFGFPHFFAGDANPAKDSTPDRFLTCIPPCISMHSPTRANEHPFRAHVLNQFSALFSILLLCHLFIQSSACWWMYRPLPTRILGGTYVSLIHTLHVNEVDFLLCHYLIENIASLSV